MRNVSKIFAKIFAKVFVLIFMLVLTTYTKDNYNRDDYKYNHSKARKLLIGYYDPYSGKLFKTPDELQIDHIVPLSLAHKLGGYLWTAQQKKDFANDRENLIMVSTKCNAKKSDKSPSEWMPKNTYYHAEYIKRYTRIINKYKLDNL